MHLFYPLKFCITIVFDFSWDHCYHHHRQLPSTSSRSAIMDLQLFRSSALLTHPLKVCPNHSLMFVIQVTLSLNRPLFPSILPSNNCFTQAKLETMVMINLGGGVNKVYYGPRESSESVEKILKFNLIC